MGMRVRGETREGNIKQIEKGKQGPPLTHKGKGHIE